MFQLKLERSTLGVPSPSHFWIICSLRWTLDLASTNRQLSLVSTWFHPSSSVRLWRRQRAHSQNWEICIVMTFLAQVALTVRYLKWKKQTEDHGEESLPTTLLFTLPHSSSLFPNIKVLLLILCTLPVTSCSAERSFSGLKRIKTALRSTMSNERLTSLALLHPHRDIDIDIPEIIDEFARSHPRRMKLINNIIAD